MFANRPSWLFILHHKAKEWDKDQKMERQIYSRDRSPAAMSWPLAQLACFGCCVRCFPWAKSQKHKKPSENISRQGLEETAGLKSPWACWWRAPAALEEGSAVLTTAGPPFSSRCLGLIISIMVPTAGLQIFPSCIQRRSSLLNKEAPWLRAKHSCYS